LQARDQAEPVIVSVVVVVSARVVTDAISAPVQTKFCAKKLISHPLMGSSYIRLLTKR